MTINDSTIPFDKVGPTRRKRNRRKGPWFDPFGEMEFGNRRRQKGNRRRNWPGQSGY